MSLVTSGLSLTHLTTIERNNAADPGDGWEGAPSWQPHLVDLPCRASSLGTGIRAGEERVVDGANVVLIENLRIIVPADTDVTVTDRITSVTSGGQTIVDGPIDIRAVFAREGVLGGGFLELTLVKVG